MKLLRVSFGNLVGQMLTYTPKLYAVDTFFWLFISGLPAIPGLIIRQFFNTLEIGKETSQLSLWIILFFIVGIARVAAIFMGRITKTQHRFLTSALVRLNLLIAIILPFLIKQLLIQKLWTLSILLVYMIGYIAYLKA